MLQAFDELGLRPHRIAGTSMGAIIGAIYASGNTASDIRASIDEMIISRGDSLRNILNKRDLRKWFDFLDPHFGRGGFVKTSSFRTFIADGLVAPTFEKLKIPTKIVAADYWSREEVVISAGDLPTAIRASMAVPGIIAPIEREGRILIDGGVVNPVPYDLWDDECDITVAIDVSGSRSSGKMPIPGVFESMFNAFQIMQRSIVNEKMKANPPDILIRPEIQGVRVFELYKSKEVYSQALPTKRHLIDALERVVRKAS